MIVGIGLAQGRRSTKSGPIAMPAFAWAPRACGQIHAAAWSAATVPVSPLGIGPCEGGSQLFRRGRGTAPRDIFRRKANGGTRCAR